MIDLLPSQQKKEVANEIRWRFLVSFFLMITLTGLVFSVILYVLNLFSIEFISAERERINRVKAEIPIAVLREGQIMSFNEVTSGLVSIYAGSVNMTETFRLLHEVLPPGSRLDSIRYERSLNEENEVVHRVTVTGNAPEWQSMLEIERGLEKRFDNISFSPGVWAQLLDIDFSISFTLK